MFYSENLLAKEGPLAQVWLAANLERKISKNQFLQSNILQSTQAIVRATSENDESEALALRLSGQLLYGVVRIYSRKAKYLLDDVSDALLRLKSAFRSNASTVTLPANATIVPSIQQLILQDTITQSDLLYQEPLTFDEEPAKPTNFFGNFVEDTTIDSIEIPRTQLDELDNLQNDDLDIDLNFDIEEDQNHNVHSDEPIDLSFDDSIEVGRDADVANLSQAPGDDYDQGADFDFGWDEPIESIIEEAEQPEENAILEAPVKKKRKPRISTAGQRRIITDRDIEIPIKAFSHTDNIMSVEEQPLSLNAKRSFIDSILKENSYIRDDIAESLLAIRYNKRQKTSLSSPLSDGVPELEYSNAEIENISQEHEEFDQEMDFDFGWDALEQPAGEEVLLSQNTEDEVPEEENLDEFNSISSQDGVSESTTKVAAHLGDLFKEKENATFTDVIERDSLSGSPLSTIPKSEATRVFFELLVLSTANAVTLKQDALFGEIEITSRSNLTQTFL